MSCIYLPSIYATSTVILFWVNVPVLSEHITETEPIVSHASFLVTKAFILAIFCIVIAKVIFIIVGSPSGTAATINATQTVNAVFIPSIESKNANTFDVSTLSPFNTIFTTININSRPAIALEILAIIVPKFPSFIWSGVSSSSFDRCLAISPIWVLSPIEVTTIIPVP